MKAISRLLVLVAFLAWPVVASAQAASAAQVPSDDQAVTNIAGRWELNWRQSDQPPGGGDAAGRDPREGGGDPAGGRGGRGGGGGGMGGRGGMGGAMPGGGRGGGRGEPSSEDRTRRDLMEDILTARRTLLIVEQRDRVTITDEHGRVQTLVPSGIKIKEERANLALDRLTRWDGRSLVTEVSLGDGIRITQTYQKVQEGLQLVVMTRVQTGRGRDSERVIRRVYDQALE